MGRNHEQQQAGTGSPRSADDGLPLEGASSEQDVGDLDESVRVGATTDSHPAEADDVKINRSGSGGTGGPSN